MSAPSKVITDAVDAREGQKCARCGLWIQNNGSRHHRQRRRVGMHGIANLVLLCGSGTTGCHGWAHANPEKAKSAGYIIPSWVESPASVPILIRWEELHPRQVHEWVLFDDAGSRTPINHSFAQELLAAFNMLPEGLNC